MTSGAKLSSAVVRLAAQSDIPELAKLLHEEARHAQRLAGYYRLRDDFDWRSLSASKLLGARRALFVAELGSHLAGFIELRARSLPAAEQRVPWRQRLNALAWWRGSRRPPAAGPIDALEWGTIEGCYVTELNRRSGIGRLLVEASLSWFRDRGIQRVELNVLANNAALVFWERVGFRAYRLSMSIDAADALQSDQSAG